METINRQEIISSLLKYLPEVANSLNKLVNNLQSLIDNDKSKDQKFLSIIYSELNLLLPMLHSLIDETKIKPEEAERDQVLHMYLESLKNIIIGISLMVEWISNNDESEDKLKNAVNSLFVAGQMIIDLVNKITQNE